MTQDPPPNGAFEKIHRFTTRMDVAWDEIGKDRYKVLALIQIAAAGLLVGILVGTFLRLPCVGF